MEIRPRLSKKEFNIINRYRSQDRRVLVIGDLHEPFSLDGYLDHCVKVRDSFNCNEIVFIGDIIDNHYSSYHESDPDGHSAGDELYHAIKRLSRWHEEFPVATVTYGNHDLLVMRKAFSSGLSRRWIKDFRDVLGVPTWQFVDELYLDDVNYVHGTGSSGVNAAYQRMMHSGMSTVIGHLHSESSIRFNKSRRGVTFGMIVGAGVDTESYSQEYGKVYAKKPIASCGVVLEGGTVPLLSIYE